MTRINILLCAVALTCLVSQAQADPRSEASKVKAGTLPLPVALEDMPAKTRDAMIEVMKSPTITAICPPEELVGHADTYKWLLDHPDRTAAAWRKLGVDAIDIKVLKDGRFTLEGRKRQRVDLAERGPGPERGVWFAEGKVKPGLLPVRACESRRGSRTRTRHERRAMR